MPSTQEVHTCCLPSFWPFSTVFSSNNQGEKAFANKATKTSRFWNKDFLSSFKRGNAASKPTSSTWSLPDFKLKSFSHFMKNCFATYDDKTQVNSLNWLNTLNKGSYSLPEIKALLSDLKEHSESGGEASHVYLIVQEVLAKKLAYKDLKKGKVLNLPYQQGDKLIWADYKVEQVCDLDKIPAYGLVSSDENAPNILLFRGTTFPSYKALLESKYAIETWKADMDVKGVGVSAFNKGKSQIEAFLGKNDKPNHIIGHSLGGAFSNLAGVHFADRVEKVTTFNAPMVSRSLKKQYDELTNKPHIQGYSCRHDVIKILGGRYLLGQQTELHGYGKDLNHHCDLVCLSDKFFKKEIDVQRVNESHVIRSVHQAAQQTLYASRVPLSWLFFGLEGIRGTYQGSHFQGV